MATAMSNTRRMNGLSQGVVDVAVAGYGVDVSTDNQENQALHKQADPGSFHHQSTTKNSRAPLTAVHPSQQTMQNFSRTTQSGAGDSSRTQNDGSSRTGNYNSSKTKGNLGKQENYDDIPENMYRPEKGEYEGWIHREKLAKIENEELQAAGINLAQARSRSRDALGNRIRDSSTDRLGGGSYQRDNTRQRISPAVSQEEEERSNWDFRSPEEIEADQPAGHTYISPLPRKSGSKIPILTSSPAPIPSERYERETPMPRKRTLSGSLTPEDTLSVTKTRSNGMDGGNVSASGQDESPIKSRSKSTTVSRPGTSSGLKGVRKVSAPAKTPSLGHGRPTTRGNDGERPRTAVNRPEGDPPWLATMYKPDPSLPPDQQLIPTLAKKQMQEQWALNGQIPKVYDRDFNSLAVDNDGRGQHVPQIDQAEPQIYQGVYDVDSNSLRPLPSNKSSSSQIKSPVISNTGIGGYSTMPKVANPPVGVMTAPNLSRPPSARASKSSSSGPAQRTSASHVPAVASLPTTKLQSHRLPQSTDEQDEKTQKKGCCCIVM